MRWAKAPLLIAWAILGLALMFLALEALDVIFSIAWFKAAKAWRVSEHVAVALALLGVFLGLFLAFKSAIKRARPG